jgi:hypothetical protein
MAKKSKPKRQDFEQALGETFSENVCPPVPFEEASAHECCEVITTVLGDDVTPTDLAALTKAQITALAEEFADFFDCDAPTAKQIKDAIADTLKRWPVGSLGEQG